MTRAVTIALTVALLAPAPAHAVLLEGVPWFPVTLKPTHVTVTRGDTLAGIAEGSGFAWERWAWVNRDEIPNPNLILPGQRLRIPLRDGKRYTPPRPAPAVSRSSGPSAPSAPNGSVWSQLAACESGGDWQANTGNGYYGGLQHSLGTWMAFGGSGYPHHHSAGTQIAVATRVQAAQGWGAWPGCAAKLGLL